jgi:hypothetical protein
LWTLQQANEWIEHYQSYFRDYSDPTGVDKRLLIHQETGDAVVVVLEQGKVVSVETIITQLERKQQKVLHPHHKDKDRFKHTIEFLISMS